MARKTKPGTIIDCLRDPNILGRQFDGKSWRSWRIFLRALFGIPLGAKERKVFTKHTQRKKPPKKATEAWLVVGRRGGKSIVAALVAVFLACFKDYSAVLGPGERGTVMILAADRKQARVVMRYVVGLLESVPMLKGLIERKLAESVDLSNRITIEVHTCSFRSVRGYSIVAAICDEIAFWRSEESASPDTEVINAIKPGMANVPGSLLLCISSPYARRGELWKAYRKHYGEEHDSVLVWQASTREMNPTIPQSLIDQALAEDEASASAEYLAQFRSDIESFVLLESLESVTIPSRRELLPNHRVRYFGFVDPSGGSRDSMTLAIGHREEDKIVLDCVREAKPPFSPEAVVAEFCQVLKSYKIRAIHGDRYAGTWPSEQFGKRGIRYIPSEMPKSQLYQNFLPLVNSGKVELLDNARLRQQLLSLERRTARSGRDSIDHPLGAHDDVANAVAGVAASVVRASKRIRSLVWGRDHRKRQEKGKIVRVTRWHDLEQLPNDQAFTMNCFFCATELRSYPKHPGKILPDGDCQMTATRQGIVWYVSCRACIERMQEEGPGKLHAEGRRRHENSLHNALREGRVEQHEFHILGGQR